MLHGKLGFRTIRHHSTRAYAQGLSLIGQKGHVNLSQLANC